MFFVFTDTATTEIYTLSLHDALPILARLSRVPDRVGPREPEFSTQLLHVTGRARQERPSRTRSEEHTSELQSLTNLVCRLLLEKKNSDSKNCRDRVTYTKMRSRGTRY